MGLNVCLNLLAIANNMRALLNEVVATLRNNNKNPNLPWPPNSPSAVTSLQGPSMRNLVPARMAENAEEPTVARNIFALNSNVIIESNIQTTSRM